jgi:hypothetical protein
MVGAGIRAANDERELMISRRSFPEDSCGTPDQKGEKRSVVSKRLLYCVNVNRTSLDHLLLGKNADVDQMSNNPSISRDRGDVRMSVPLSTFTCLATALRLSVGKKLAT